MGFHYVQAAGVSASIDLPGWRFTPYSEAIHPILLRLADMSGLKDISMSVFGYMRSFIAAQPHREQQIIMALQIEKMLCQRFGVLQRELNAWKKAMSQQWSTNARIERWGLASFLRYFGALGSRPEPLGPSPLRAELRLEEVNRPANARLYRGRDNMGRVRIELLIGESGEARLRSYDLTTGSWHRRNLSLRNPTVPVRALVLNAMEQMSDACGWRFSHW